MKKAILIILLVLSALICKAQETPGFDRIALKITPTSLFNPHVATIQPGLEIRFHPKWSLQGEYGFQYEKLALLDWNWKKKDWRYHKIKGSVRYTSPIDDATDYYIALEAFAVDQRYYKLNDLLLLDDGQYYMYDSSNIERYTRGVSLNFGITTEFSKHCFIEWYAGGGWKKVYIYHEAYFLSGNQNPNEREWFFPNKDEQAGTWSLLHVDFGIKLGFSFCNSQRRASPKDE